MRAFYSGYGRIQNFKTGIKDDETINTTGDFYLLPCDVEKLRQTGYANIFALKINNNDNIDYIFRLTDSKGNDYTFDVTKDNSICIGNNNDIVKNTLRAFFDDDALQANIENNAPPIQHNNKLKEKTSLLIAPTTKDEWFEVINEVVDEFHAEHGVKPSKGQVLGILCTNPPHGYAITVNENGCLNMIGGKSLSKSSFIQRAKRYGLS